MKITKISARELDSGLCARWQTIQDSNPDLATPYFCFEYTQAVAAARDNVYVGVLEDNNTIIGFFPWEQKSRDVIGPVGGRLSDYQGAIIPPQQQWNVEALMKAYGIKVWEFDHLLSSQKPQARHSVVYPAHSAFIDLSAGFASYLQKKKSSGSKHLVKLQRLERKFEKEVGEVRFDLYAKDNTAFDKVIEWKSAQCVRTGLPEFLKWNWVRVLLEHIRHTGNQNFSGMLTVLSTDKEIIAAHFGMRSQSVCHWWFPVYNRAYSKYSPGGILLLKFAEAAAMEGLRIVDLGKGDEMYKSGFATGKNPLVEGCVVRPSITGARGLLKISLEHFIRHSSVMAPARKIRKEIKRF